MMNTGHSSSEHDEMVSALPTLKERAKRSDANVLFSVIKDLGKVHVSLYKIP